MRAVDLLAGRDTADLRVRLLPVLPEQVPVRRMPGPLLPRWVAAITLPWAIYVRSELLGSDPARLARLIAHELVHARQWRTLGAVRFLWRYARDYLRGRARRLGHRAAYQAIGLEAEARRIADRL